MKVLAIGAHADDVELGLGGTIARHVSKNDNVHILIITDSEYKNFDGTKIRTKKTACQEALKAARIMGVNKVNFLDYKTKEVKYDVNLIEDINAVIDQVEPDVIYTHWDGDINQDHSAIAQATIVAGRHVPRILMYRSNWYKSYKHFENNFYVDITDFIQTKIDAVKAHKSEHERRGSKWSDFFKYNCRIAGQEVGVEYAESFQVIKWLDK